MEGGMVRVCFLLKLPGLTLHNKKTIITITFVHILNSNTELVEFLVLLIK